MKRTLIGAAVAAAAILAIPATAQMMGGWGPGYGPGYARGYGMGPGMMWGYGGYGYGYGYDDVKLTSEQRAKIARIQDDFRNKQWALMTAMRQQMFDNSVAARKSMDAVLTPEQRKELGR